MKMEKGKNELRKWSFQVKPELKASSSSTVRGVLNMLEKSLNEEDKRPVVHLGIGDPSYFPSFRTAAVVEDAIIDSLRSAKYNCYPPTGGILSARRAIADYLSHDLPFKLSPDDVYITTGCSQAIEIALNVIARPGANVLLPRPGYPYYKAHAGYNGLEIRYYDLIPEKGWEIDLNAVVALSDENTAAMVVINPGNPCGNVFSYEHLKAVAETARELGILIIGDEAYDKLAFGSSPYVPVRAFSSIVPVLTLGSISKRWIVPGWRLGWLVTNDPNGILQKSGIIESITGLLNISADPATFIQAAVPQILENTKEDFFSKIISLLREGADLCYTAIQDIPCITCPYKPEGSMSVMVKPNLSMLEDINDDVDFCNKLAEEESVIILPGITLGLKNWLRITFSVEHSSLEEGLARLKAFCHRHAKKL